MSGYPMGVPSFSRIHSGERTPHFVPMLDDRRMMSSGELPEVPMLTGSPPDSSRILSSESLPEVPSLTGGGGGGAGGRGRDAPVGMDVEEEDDDAVPGSAW
eukprot:PLAT11836.1.p2 GENE.PLAT11836.1~~PLAT11836.1.p2  ORF type:complete len:101 (+),score=26.92 PLAT11836.1:122-424(+)